MGHAKGEGLKIKQCNGFEKTLIKCPWERIAALRGVRNLACHIDM